MRRNEHYLGMAVALACGSVAPAIAEETLGRIRAGAEFPELALPTLSEGGRATLRDFRGRPAVLLVFASW